MGSHRRVYLYLLFVLWFAPVFTALYGAGDDLLYGYSTDSGLILHSVLSLSMIAGAALFLFISSGWSGFVPSQKQAVLKNSFFQAGYLIALFGLFAAIYSSTYNKGVGQHFADLASGSAEVRDDFLLSSKDGGVSGFIKMFAFGPLSVFLAASSIVYFYKIDLSQRSRLNRLLYFTIFCSFLKAAFSIDRLTLVAILLVGFAFMIRRFSIIRFFLLVAVLAATSWISSRRLADYGLLDFFSLYLNLGLVNLGLLEESLKEYALGFETILQPFLFILNFFDLQGVYSPAKYDWAWNPAQYLFGFMFMDFGYFSVVPLSALSYFLLWLENKARFGGRAAVFVYFHVLYCLVSFLGVPAFRGLEFWFGILIAFIMARYCIVHSVGQGQRIIPNVKV